MNSTYVNNVPVSTGELSVVTTDNASKSMRHSCKMASTLHKAGMNVLLINCGMSPQRFREYAPDINSYFGYNDNEEFGVSDITDAKEGEARMMTLDSVRGDLVSMSSAIRESMIQCQIRAVIICGWEWSSSTWRRRERLLFFLKEMMAEFQCTVVVYAQTGTTPTAGEYDRGGIGRLATLAVAVADIRGVELAAELAPSVAPIIMTEAEWFEHERRAQLEPKETNILQMPKSRIVPDKKRAVAPPSVVAFQQVN